MMITPDEYQKLNRKQRRALEHGTMNQQEVRAYLDAKYGINPPYVEIKDHTIILPHLTNENIKGRSDLYFVMPMKDIPDKYWEDSHKLLSGKCSGTEPSFYKAVLHKWFHAGLANISFTMKSNVVKWRSSNRKIEDDFAVYVRFILQSMDRNFSQSWKISYLTYVFDMCLEKLEVEFK